MSTVPRFRNGESRIVAIIGDEDTVTGFLLAGVGDNRVSLSSSPDTVAEGSKGGNVAQPNYFVVNPSTPLSDIEAAFTDMTTRNDIGIIVICQHIANDIRHLVEAYTGVIPCILEIPSKGLRYDAEKDYVLEKVSRALGIR